MFFSEFASKRPPFKDDDASSVHTHLTDYDAAKHNPVFFQNNQLHARVETDGQELEDFDPAVCHPSVAGHAFIDRPPQSPPATPAPPPNKQTCEWVFIMHMLGLLSLSKFSVGTN